LSGPRCLAGGKFLRQGPCLLGIVAGDLRQPGQNILLGCRWQGQAVSQSTKTGEVLV